MHESEKWKGSRSVVSDTLRPHGPQPTRLLCPWDFPGKSTGVGCHRLLRSQVMLTWYSVKPVDFLTGFLQLFFNALWPWNCYLLLIIVSSYLAMPSIHSPILLSTPFIQKINVYLLKACYMPGAMKPSISPSTLGGWWFTGFTFMLFVFLSAFAVVNLQKGTLP